jgi:dolichol-phosphate mannosyltransferase
MPELTVVVPAFRERDNIPSLLAALDKALAGLDWETIVVVDDAFDGSEDVVRRRAQQDGRVRCIHRIGRRGLASACIEGMLASSAPYLAVIDADLQHDETLVPKLLAAAKAQEADVVVASRYMEGGSTGELAGERVRISRLASALSRVLCNGSVQRPERPDERFLRGAAQLPRTRGAPGLRPGLQDPA